jgi:hypothetical protein
MKVSLLTISSITLLLIFGCGDELDNLQMVYENDFENSNGQELSGALYSDFNGSQVLGMYNNDGFNLQLRNLPEHNQLIINFELYIHDSWDGNADGVDGPDIWQILIDPFNSNSEGPSKFTASFSNTDCDPVRCLTQSYPFDYPFSRPPRTGTTASFPGVCSQDTNETGTSQYSIEKIFYHSGDNLVVRFEDFLVQSNTSDGKCDESWSLDNLEIWVADYR